VRTALDPDDEPEDGGQHRRRRFLALVPIQFVALLFYVWTGTTEKVNPYATGSLAKLPDAYNSLTNAFLKGHLSLLDRPPVGFTSLKDPYDPAQNAFWSGLYHDLAYYKGRLYLSWGPTPVVTLLMPWRLLHHGSLPVNVGVVIYCCVGLVACVALLCVLVDRYLPNTKTWQLAFATAALALCNVAPFLLRRPDVYELAISSAYCFTMLGGYLLASGGLVRPLRRWRLAAGSLSIGLAIGGRPDLIFEGLFLVALLVYLVRRDHPGRTATYRCAGLLLGPFSVILVLLALYNYGRFGSPLQNGATYALGAVEMTKVPMYQAKTLVPNLYYYVVAPVRWTYAFPYIALPPPPAYPWPVASFYHGEMTGGLLTTTPIILASIPAIALFARRGLRELRRVLLAILGVGVLTLLFLTVVLPGTTMRYETDDATFFLLPALIGWLALSSGRGRRVIAILGAAVILYGCFIGTAISFSGYFDGLRTEHPGSYWALARLTSPLPTVAAMIAGHPVVARAFPAGATTNGTEDTYQLDKDQFGIGVARVELDIISPSNGHWSLAPTFSRSDDAGSHRVSIAVELDDGSAYQVEVNRTPTAIPLMLHRGLNRVEMHATNGKPHQIPTTVLVSVQGLRLVKSR